jgi:hypothetical protein
MWGDIKKWAGEAKDVIVSLFDTIADWVIPPEFRELLKLMGTGTAAFAGGAPTGAANRFAMVDANGTPNYDLGGSATSGWKNGNSGVTVGDVTINVSGAGDPHAVAQEINQSFADQLSSTLQEAHAQLGAPPTRQN